MEYLGGGRGEASAGHSNSWKVKSDSIIQMNDMALNRGPSSHVTDSLCSLGTRNLSFPT